MIEVEEHEGQDKFIVYNEDGSITVILEYPLELKNGEKITEITLRRPRGADAEAAEKVGGGPVSQTNAMIASCSRPPVPIGAVRQLDGSDLRKLTQFLEGCLMGKSRATTGGV